MSTRVIAEKTIPEIEVKLKTIGGEMVKIEYLENCLKQNASHEVRKFCHVKLADLYAAQKLYAYAIKHLDSAAEGATTYKDKMQLYLSETLLYLKKGEYFGLDNAFKKALASANDIEKEQIKQQVKKEFFKQAKEFESTNRRANAITIYERILQLPFVSQIEKDEVIRRLHGLYLQVGRIADAMKYKNLVAQQKK